MDPENGSRADLALPTPQEPSSVPEIELSEVPCHDSSLLEKAAPSPPLRTWLTFLKRELEFLGVSKPLPTSIKVRTGSRKEYLVAPIFGFPLGFMRSKEPVRGGVDTYWALLGRKKHFLMKTRMRMANREWQDMPTLVSCRWINVISCCEGFIIFIFTSVGGTIIDVHRDYVTQILVGLKCLCFGTIVYSTLKISEFEEDFFSSFKTGYPFWGAVIFATSGLLSVMSERKQATYLVRGSLGANLVSSVAAATGMVILVANLRNSSAYIYVCQEAYEDDFCLAAFFSTKIVAMILFLTILGFGSAVSLTVYGIGELLKKEKIPEDILYEELNIYSPIYSELEDRGETSSPADS